MRRVILYTAPEDYTLFFHKFKERSFEGNLTKNSSNVYNDGIYRFNNTDSLLNVYTNETHNVIMIIFMGDVKLYENWKSLKEIRIRFSYEKIIIDNIVFTYDDKD